MICSCVYNNFIAKFVQNRGRVGRERVGKNWVRVGKNWVRVGRVRVGKGTS